VFENMALRTNWTYGDKAFGECRPCNETEPTQFEYSLRLRQYEAGLRVLFEEKVTRTGSSDGRELRDGSRGMLQ
jgi:hypothetical protein